MSFQSCADGENFNFKAEVRALDILVSFKNIPSQCTLTFILTSLKITRIRTTNFRPFQFYTWYSLVPKKTGHEYDFHKQNGRELRSNGERSKE